ncbi:hypothetical protein MKW92_001014, partial [Papaver armeniacum]
GKLNKALAEPVESLLDAGSSLQRETKTAVSGFTDKNSRLITSNESGIKQTQIPPSQTSS